MVIAVLAWFKRRKVHDRYHAAFVQHRKAVERGDKRAMHETRRALTLVQCERLRLGL